MQRNKKNIKIVKIIVTIIWQHYRNSAKNVYLARFFMNVKFWERGFKYEKICTFQKKNYELKMHIGEIFIQKNLNFLNI